MRWWAAVIAMSVLSVVEASAQTPPAVAHRPWSADSSARRMVESSRRAAPFAVDPVKVYSLAELIDLAQRHNPDTRAAWEQARAEAASLGVARSELYPALTAAALAQTSRSDVLVGNRFFREDVNNATLTFDLSYMALDFGGRAARIERARAEALAANLAFNDVHRRLIFRVSDAYYRLLSAAGQEDAARASLANARTVQRAVEERLAAGLATLPDVLETRSAAAQADYELQSAIGGRDIALGDLAAALGTMPSADLRVQPLAEITAPDAIGISVDAAIARAFADRPDLGQQIAETRAADARAREARAARFPTVTLLAHTSPELLHGLEQGYRWTGSRDVVGRALVSVDWTLFDGGARRRTLIETQAAAAAAAARADGARDRVANDVWGAYARFTTALRRRQAASALLESASQSYAAALESYTLGVRSLLDVTAAQRTLAQARSADVLARTEALTSLAELAYQTGESIRSSGRQP
jgi:outer membrane protein TolC